MAPLEIDQALLQGGGGGRIDKYLLLGTVWCTHICPCFAYASAHVRIDAHTHAHSTCTLRLKQEACKQLQSARLRTWVGRDACVAQAMTVEMRWIRRAFVLSCMPGDGSPGRSSGPSGSHN